MLVPSGRGLWSRWVRFVGSSGFDLWSQWVRFVVPVDDVCSPSGWGLWVPVDDVYGPQWVTFVSPEGMVYRPFFFNSYTLLEVLKFYEPCHIQLSASCYVNCARVGDILRREGGIKEIDLDKVRKGDHYDEQEMNKMNRKSKGR